MSVLGGISDCFGLDIGTDVIRVVQLRGSGNNKTVFRFGEAPIDSRLVKSNTSETLKQLAEAIRKILNQAKITTRNVVMGIPTQQCFLVIKEFDNLSSSDLDKSIKFKINTIIPSNIKDSKVDWAPLGDKPNKTGRREVLIASTQNVFIEKRLEMLESINLDPLAFEPDALAVFRALKTDSAESFIIVDVDHKQSDILAAYEGHPRLIDSINFGLTSIIKNLNNSFKSTPEESHQFIFQTGLQGDQTVQTNIVHTLKALIDRIQRSINFFNNRYTDKLVSKIILSGEISLMPGLASYLANVLQIPVEIADSWRNVKYPDQIKSKLQLVATSFATAAGLAER